MMLVDSLVSVLQIWQVQSRSKPKEAGYYNKSQVLSEQAC